jgi:ribosomal 30S subunit maturation factor RimM
MTSRQSPEPGMEVVTNDGTVLGHVKDVSDTAKYFRVDCRHAPDLYIPHNYIQDTGEGNLVIRARKDQVPYLGWELRPETY